MKVLLVQPYMGGSDPPVFPLGIACIRSSLNSHDVRVFDTNTSERPLRELKSIIEGYVPEVIGISLRNIDSTNKRRVVFYYKYFKDTIDVIESCSNARIIVGGSGFSMYAREIMEDEPGIDFGVYLEGEAVFPRLLENLEMPEDVRSVYYRKNGEVLFSGSCPLPDLNCLNIPDRSVLSLEEYKKHRDSVGVETKRGCVLNCIYCVYPFLNGRAYRLKSPMLVVDEIEQLVNRYGVEQFTFIDSVFNIPKEHSEEICREMIRRGVKVKWSAWFSEKNLTREFLELAKRAGCDHVVLSPDGFSDEILEKLGKNINRKDILRAYRILQEMDCFEISYNFFKNPPGQNLGNFISLILFFLRAKLKLRKRVHFEFNSLRIEAHTQLYELAQKEGLIEKNVNLLYPGYYTNAGTVYIEKIFNMMLRLKGA